MTHFIHVIVHAIVKQIRIVNTAIIPVRPRYFHILEMVLPYFCQIEGISIRKNMIEDIVN